MTSSSSLPGLDVFLGNNAEVVEGAEAIACLLREELQESVNTALARGSEMKKEATRALRQGAALEAQQQQQQQPGDDKGKFWEIKTAETSRARELAWRALRPPSVRGTVADALDLVCLGPSVNERSVLEDWCAQVRSSKKGRANNDDGGETDGPILAFIEAAAHHDWAVRCARLASQPGAEALLKRETATASRVFDAKRQPLRALLELELNVRIRDVQSRLADEMLAAGEQLHSTMFQLNMGEGKTSVILPMLALEMADGTALARLTVLAQLQRTCRSHLRHVLGGILGMKVWELPFNRDIQLDEARVGALSSAVTECINDGGVLVTVPEHRLSYQLKTVETALKGKGESSDAEHGAAQKARALWRLMERSSRDVLDECDEVLHPKWQMVYTHGPQSGLDGGGVRWSIASAVLSAVRTLATEAASRFPDVVQLVGETPLVRGGVLGVRLASGEAAEARVRECEAWLFQAAARLVLERREGVDAVESLALPARRRDVEAAVAFVCSPVVPDEWPTVACELQSEDGVMDSLLTLRGMLAYESLGHCLRRTWRVHFGVRDGGASQSDSCCATQMAVPFRAADVPAPRASFGHADVAIMLTLLSYTYAGLSVAQFQTCVERLVSRDDKTFQYSRWLQWCSDEARTRMPPTAESINLRDAEQLARMHSLCSNNPAVVELHLTMMVFPREAKRFPEKLSASAWDLCWPHDAGDTNEAVDDVSNGFCGVPPRRRFSVVGFSGSVDAKLCFPHGVRQTLVSPETSGAVVLNMLGKGGDSCVDVLPEGAAFEHVLRCATDAKCRVITDASALAVGKNTEHVARAWLELVGEERSPSTWGDGGGDPDAVVFFRERDDELMLLERGANGARGVAVRLRDSPRASDLSQCLVLLDQARTRGVDLKFPPRAKALVTIGPGLTKDRLAQACMRMRRLGDGQTVRFAVAAGAMVHAHKRARRPKLADCVAFCLRQTQRELRDGLVHWSAQALSFCVHVGGQPAEHETFRLQDLYGPSREHALVRAAAREMASTVLGSGRAQKWEVWVGARLDLLLPTYARVAQTLDEEQERELEQEQEREMQIERPPPWDPFPPSVSHEARRLAQGVEPLALEGLLGLDKFYESRAGIAFAPELARVSEGKWEGGLWCTTSFANTAVLPEGTTSTEFLRPVAWLLVVGACGNVPRPRRDIVLLSAFEANELLPALRANAVQGGTRVSLHTFLPRCRRAQWSCLCDVLALPRALSTPSVEAFEPPLGLRVAAGALFFETRTGGESTEQAEWSEHAGKHRSAVRAVMNARWAGSSAARHVGSDVAMWLVRPDELPDLGQAEAV